MKLSLRAANQVRGEAISKDEIPPPIFIGVGMTG
jgi:hypothetical protein